MPYQEIKTSEVDKAIHFICYLILEKLSRLVPNNSLYTIRDDWTELERFRLQIRNLSLIFAALPKPFIQALKILRLQPTQLEVTELNVDVNFLMRLEYQPAITASCINRSVLLALIG